MPPETRVWTILDVLSWTAAFFSDHRVEAPRVSAELLLAHVLGIKRLDLYLRYDQPLTPDELAAFRSLVSRRKAGEPVAYILGEKAFWSMDLIVTPDVLIPRPDTECLVETALSFLAGPGSDAAAERWVLEPATGSGAVVLALAKSLPGGRFFAFDRSTAALAVARKNAVRYDPAHCVVFFASDWFSALGNAASGRFDMIVANPPYVASGDIDHLAPEIGFEPRMALDGGADGLGPVRHILQAAGRLLKPGGRLLIEIGWDQKERVARAVQQAGLYTAVGFAKDLAGHHRVVHMQRAGQ
ncbi:MAG: peptide chain release factor N(5)-glutamine methyltransferase [Thermodesulfobacteriota bacterium]|nr:peptide chain release factor N(5)-glutamine methyltransferase [Thermodesulfobacteriota bacterium]